MNPQTSQKVRTKIFWTPLGPAYEVRHLSSSGRILKREIIYLKDEEIDHRKV